MTPTEPTRPDGRGGLIDAEDRHWPHPVHRPDWFTNPPSQVGRFIKTGDVIETSMPHSDTDNNIRGYYVFHHRVSLTFPSYTIQMFANGLIEEWTDAFGMTGSSHIAFGDLCFHGLTTMGAPRCKNLSSPADEAIGNNFYRPHNHPNINDTTLPLRSAALVRKHTSILGKGGTGFFRMFFIPEQRQTAGVLDRTYINAMNAAMADIANYVDASIRGGATALLALYHKEASEKTGTVQTTPVNSVSTGTTLSSVRGRQTVRS